MNKVEDFTAWYDTCDATIAHCEGDGVTVITRFIGPNVFETQVMARWQCKKRWLRALINGHHPKGIYLPAVRLSAKELRFRARDVIKVEEQLRQST